ncbi:MAG: cell division protein ZapA [Clostridia bacterium]|nr:cell division protein ZapA [Clostridia bacterium]
MDKKKVRIVICSTEYTVVTEDSAEYLQSLAAELDKTLRELVEGGRRVSMTQASVLLALHYLDEKKKAEQSTDNIRDQLKEYLQDAAKARMEADDAKRENERLKKEIEVLKARLGERSSSGSGTTYGW